MYDYGYMNSADALIGLLTGGFVLLFIFPVAIFMIITYWKLFDKAEQPGWASIIPIYQTLIILKVAKKPWWWIFIPVFGLIPIIGWIASFVIGILIMHGISTNFGKDGAYTVGLIFLPIVFLPILAFGSSIYMEDKDHLMM